MNVIAAWVGILGSLVTIGVSVGAALHFQRRRDKSAAVGAFFKDVVDSLASDNETLRMAAAILLRRFFDAQSEQGAAHLPYAGDAVNVIAGLLRECETGTIQKILADGLRYAPSLAQADLQGCNLSGAYLGQKEGDEKAADLTNADLYKANLTGASLKGVNAVGAVFFEATLVKTVLSGADLSGANFRDSKLDGAKFDGAQLTGADFSGASDIPAEVASRLNATNKL
jgi:uncharacterized protein YjbI with pentapeptide repeats